MEDPTRRQYDKQRLDLPRSESGKILTREYKWPESFREKVEALRDDGWQTMRITKSMMNKESPHYGTLTLFKASDS